MHYIYQHYYHSDWARYMEQDKWIIEIKSTSQYDAEYYNNSSRAEELDFSIPHGVTGKGTIKCYITDVNNNLVLLQNMAVICHELAHMVLQVYYPDKMVKMRNDDFLGKAGDSRKFFSSEVHDRLAEGRIKAFKYPISRWRKQSFLGIDLEDITNSRNINRVGYNDWKTGKLIE